MGSEGIVAKQFDRIGEAHRAFIARQRIFFVASAAPNTRVNVSPRGTDGLRVLGHNLVAYLDRTGSGNETAAHARAGGPVTVMFCAFDGAPSILRLYGRGTALHREGAAFRRVLDEQFDGTAPRGTRQIMTVAVDLVQTSCGYGVPLFGYDGERPSLDNWANAKTDEEIDRYWHDKNETSLDGLPTGLFEA